MITWLVTGGTNFWKDIPEKYRSILDIPENEVLTVAQVNEQTTNFEYKVQCSKPRVTTKSYEHAINLTQGNQVSRTLLRPATHHI